MHKGIHKQQGGVQPLRNGGANQPPVQPGNKTVEGTGNGCGPGLGFILDARPGDSRHGRVELLGHKLPDLVPIARFDGGQHRIQKRIQRIKVIVGGDTAGTRTTGRAVLLVQPFDFVKTGQALGGIFRRLGCSAHALSCGLGG